MYSDHRSSAKLTAYYRTSNRLGRRSTPNALAIEVLEGYDSLQVFSSQLYLWGSSRTSLKSSGLNARLQILDKDEYDIIPETK